MTKRADVAASEHQNAATSAVFALFAVWLAMVIYQGWTRSAWMDEFFTAIVTDPHVSLREHLPTWKTEPHPATYSFLLWAYRHVVDVGPSIFSLRSLSIGLSVLLAIGALAYWRACKWPRLPLFAFFMFTSPAIVFFPQETRSYFLLTFGGVYASLYLLRAFEAEAPDRPKLKDILVGVVAAALLSVHLISIAFAGLLFGMACVAMAIERRWSWLTTTILIGVVVIGPALAIILMTIFGALESTLQSFWITRWQLVLTVYSLPFATGAPIVVTLLYALWRRRDIAGRLPKTAAALALAIVLSIFILGCISLIKPILVVRYLCAPLAALAPLCAILASALAPSLHPRAGIWRGPGLALLALAAFIAALFNADLSPKSDWRTPATTLNAASSCNSAIVPYLILNHEPDPANLWRRDFEWYAPGHEFLPATEEVQRQASGQPCTVKLWVAHRVLYNIPPGYRDSVARACAGPRATALVFVDGFLVVDNRDAASISAWPGESMSCEAMLQTVQPPEPRGRK